MHLGRWHGDGLTVTTALCPGSFDPLTNGHVDVINRCVDVFDRVVVAVVENPSKQSTFDLEQRKRFIAEAFGDQVHVVSFTGLLVAFAKEQKADVIVKGLRGNADFEYELQMAQMNRQVAGVDTMFITTSPAYSFVSSSLIKEVAALGGDISSLVPAGVARALKERNG